MHVLRFPPTPEVSNHDDAVTQVRLRDLAQRMRDHEEEGKRLAELSAELINDIDNGALIEPGLLVTRIVSDAEGAKIIYRVVIEAARRAMPLLLLVAG